MQNFYKTFFIVCIFAQALQAKILLVSDIDDTIKISHVKSMIDIAVYAPQTRNVFLGVSELYQEIDRQYNSTNTSEKKVDFLYLTNALNYLMANKHKTFIEDNHFPDGEISLLKSFYTSGNHKIEKLRQVLNTNKYSEVILIGDNGENDTIIYNQIKNEYPKIQFHTYIHQLYSVKNKTTKGQPLFVNQVGFVTPIEIAIDLEQKQILDSLVVKNYINGVLTPILQASTDKIFGEIVFPKWMDCSDFQFTSYFLNRLNKDRNLEPLTKLVQYRCSSNFKPKELPFRNLRSSIR